MTDRRPTLSISNREQRVRVIVHVVRQNVINLCLRQAGSKVKPIVQYPSRDVPIVENDRKFDRPSHRTKEVVTVAAFQVALTMNR